MFAEAMLEMTHVDIVWATDMEGETSRGNCLLALCSSMPKIIHLCVKLLQVHISYTSKMWVYLQFQYCSAVVDLLCCQSCCLPGGVTLMP